MNNTNEKPLMNVRTPPTDPWAFLTALRIKHEAAAALARKEVEDKKLIRLKPWWLQASQ